MNDQPPVLTPAVSPPRAVVGRIGRAFAILGLAALTLLIVFKPG